MIREIPYTIEDLYEYLYAEGSLEFDYRVDMSTQPCCNELGELVRLY